MRRTHEQSTGELVEAFSKQAAELARKEARLAGAELRRKARWAAIGASIASGAVGFATLAAGSLTAALVVGCAYAAVAGFLAVVGRGALHEIDGPLPARTLETLREDAAWLTTRPSSSGR
ncbi:MAG TPA: phage holin family protein [Gaiellales bacterium]|nr:phage holin family protein [Gaiellales bacterium]